MPLWALVRVSWNASSPAALVVPGTSRKRVARRAALKAGAARFDRLVFSFVLGIKIDSIREQGLNNGR
jgi:hypothetical protein